jgi:hypothetical protein
MEQLLIDIFFHLALSPAISFKILRFVDPHLPFALFSVFNFLIQIGEFCIFSNASFISLIVLIVSAIVIVLLSPTYVYLLLMLVAFLMIENKLAV